MNLNKKQLNRIRWTARILGTLIFLFLFPFYVGYGFPIPDSSMSLLENLWLTIMPFFLTGLVIGWKWEKIAGYIITIPILIGLIAALIYWEDPSFITFFALIPGVLYLVYGYNR